ncbi:hypothetical protein KFK09_019536 [Dendrobium nobile]|uniref:leucine--tRNA ligase n=1 Tax=Dendrobium nobile TaxID=94219 RepID=A0A8T3APR8_DENNO|nr:hypothetical protein KFK09_019536 [Dendrobium nobile]
MPIKASADKLAIEMEQYGNPPLFPSEEDFTDEIEESKIEEGNLFTPLAKKDLKSFGLGCDWRRTFITTDMNPFYDSFVKWQMRKLKGMGKIVKDLRYTIYSPLDGQPCADHDLASSEGVQPQDYVLIKMEVIPPFPSKFKMLEGRDIFLAAATLRPETMYGQTNCWVLPEGKYGAFKIHETDVFILTQRSTLNLAYQKVSRVLEKATCLLELSGLDLNVIYALPMLTILTDKGTGIVTSVPSDSPDDYMDEWVLPFDIIPIINIPDFGDKSAEKVCHDLKIKRQNDKEKLVEAKRLTYLKGFTDGRLLVGEFEGMKVQEAKPLIKKLLLETGQAVVYLQDSIILMRKLLQKQLSGSKKSKKIANLNSEDNMFTVGLIYVNEKYDGWKEECLMMDDALHVGVHALDLKLPFDEIEVLRENLDLIRRQLGLEHVEILSASDESACRKAGPFINLLIQNPPSPGNPVSIFLSKIAYANNTSSESPIIGRSPALGRNFAKSEGPALGRSLTSIGGQEALQHHLGGVSASRENSIVDWEELQHPVEVG